MAKAKPRKWSNFKGTLPEPPPDVSERFKKVLALKDKFIGSPMDVLAARWAELEREDAEAEKAASARSVEYDALEMRILEELDKVQAVAGTDIWRGQGQTFSPRLTVCPIVRDKMALKKWIEDTKQQDLLSLAPATLKSLVCALLEQVESMTPAERAKLKNEPGQPGQPPPGVEVFLKPGVNRTSQGKDFLDPATPVDMTPFDKSTSKRTTGPR